ncbi:MULTISPECIES: A24 family peptidase [Microbacterium]|nr:MULTISPECIES: A24 family peptidase [Microbacterium]
MLSWPATVVLVSAMSAGVAFHFDGSRALRSRIGAAAAAGFLALLGLVVGGHTAPPALAATVALLGAAAVIDLRTMRIPNAVSIGLAAGALSGWAAGGAPLPALICAFATGLIMLAAYSFGGTGAGDVKALPSLVLAATTPCAQLPTAAFVASSVLLASFGITMALHQLGRMRVNEPVPLAPGLFLAGVAALAVYA